MLRARRTWLVLWPMLLLAGLVPAAGAQVGWLRYAIPPDPPRYHDLPHTVVVLGNAAGHEAPEEAAAADELDRGLGHMVAGTDLLLHRFDPRVDALVLGTTEALHRARIGRSLPRWTEKPLPEEGFRIVHLRRGIRQWYILQGGSPRAELWAAFRFAALVAEDQQLPEELIETPQIGLRGIDVGSGEDAAQLLANETRLTALARLLASVGGNTLLAGVDAQSAAPAAHLLQGFGIRLWLRVDDMDALLPGRSAQLASSVPGLGGLVVSLPAHAPEQRLRQAIGQANDLAAALPRGVGVLLDGALGDPLQPGEASSAEQRAAVVRATLAPRVLVSNDLLPPSVPLAGLGSPGFGLLRDWPEAALLDVLPAPTDELAFPYRIWQHALETPVRGPHGDTTILDLLHVTDEGSQRALLGRLSAADLAHVMDQPLLQANLYGFGRLAWNPSLGAEAVAEEWARQTWGDDARIFAVAQHMVLASAGAYVGNTAPFGLPPLAGPDGGPRPSRVNLRGRLADTNGIGTGRAEAAALYPDGLAAQLKDAAQCPDEWLLAFHRVPYTATLHSGKTVAQGFYDAHYAGAAQAANAVDAWEETKDLLPPERYGPVHSFLEDASRRAEIWRETTTEWLQRISHVPDALGFTGHHPGRVEAESMRLTGYAPRQVAEREDASDGSVVVCNAQVCAAATTFTGEANVYRVEVGTFAATAAAKLEVRVNGKVQASWPVAATSGATAVPAFARRFVVNGVRLGKGDVLEVRCTGDAAAQPPLDFVEVTRDPRWN